MFTCFTLSGPSSAAFCRLQHGLSRIFSFVLVIVGSPWLKDYCQDDLPLNNIKRIYRFMCLQMRNISPCSWNSIKPVFQIQILLIRIRLVTLIRIRILLFNWIRSRSRLFDQDPFRVTEVMYLKQYFLYKLTLLLTRGLLALVFFKGLQLKKLWSENFLKIIPVYSTEIILVLKLSTGNSSTKAI